MEKLLNEARLVEDDSSHAMSIITADYDARKIYAQLAHHIMDMVRHGGDDGTKIRNSVYELVIAIDLAAREDVYSRVK